MRTVSPLRPGLPLVVSSLSIMAERLSRIPEIKKTVLVLKKPDKAIITAARQADWQVIDNRNPFLKAIRFAARLLFVDYLLFFDLRYPFIDPATCGELLAKLDRTRLLRIKNGFEMAPRLIIHRYTLVKLKLLQYLNKNQAGLLEFAAKTMRPPEYRAESVILPQTAALLDTRLCNQTIVEQLGGITLTKASLEKLEGSPGFSPQTVLDATQNYLVKLRETSQTPYYWNTVLNQLERRFAVREVKSFPLDVALNPTTVCNAHCLFCNYPQMVKQGEHFLGLKEIQEMSWLKYPNKLGFGGGLGDPLVHPEFSEIFEYVTANYPHLTTRVITNGIGLTPALCEAFAGKLSRLRVSLNAATEETWEKLMRSKGFAQICANLKYLKQLKEQCRTSKPEVWLLFVVNRENLTEMVDFTRLAAAVGAEVVCYNHFEPGIMPQCKLDISASPYFAKETFDRELEKTQKVARQLGIKVSAPPSFAASSQHYQGMRVLRAPQKCHEPWENCMLAVDSQSHRELSFCCVGIRPTIPYDLADLTDSRRFMAVWNHPTIQHFRATVNQPDANPVCRFCYTQDQVDPEQMNSVLKRS
jgi:MoaA/NifB/PqqE/SkfB family radical SAM enzyme